MLVGVPPATNRFRCARGCGRPTMFGMLTPAPTVCPPPRSARRPPPRRPAPAPPRRRRRPAPPRRASWALCLVPAAKHPWNLLVAAPSVAGAAGPRRFCVRRAVVSSPGQQRHDPSAPRGLPHRVPHTCILFVWSHFPFRRHEKKNFYGIPALVLTSGTAGGPRREVEMGGAAWGARRRPSRAMCGFRSLSLCARPTSN